MIRKSNEQFGLKGLFISTTVFASSFALLAGGIAAQSPFLLFSAMLLFGAAIGGVVGFFCGGRFGVMPGVVIGMLCLFAIYAASIRSLK